MWCMGVSESEGVVWAGGVVRGAVVLQRVDERRLLSARPSVRLSDSLNSQQQQAASRSAGWHGAKLLRYAKSLGKRPQSFGTTAIPLTYTSQRLQSYHQRLKHGQWPSV